MGALTLSELDLVLDVGADVVAWREEFVRAVEAGTTADRPARVHVKLDTGMRRLGAPDPDRRARSSWSRWLLRAASSWPA